jgi:hypothetical protein
VMIHAAPGRFVDPLSPLGGRSIAPVTITGIYRARGSMTVAQSASGTRR